MNIVSGPEKELPAEADVYLPPESEPVRLRSPRRKIWRAPLRWLAIAGSILGGLAICGLIAAVALVARLDKGPISVDALGSQIAASLQRRIGDGHIVTVKSTAIEKGEGGPALTVEDFVVTGPRGDIVLAAPKARVTLDMMSLVLGEVVPKRLNIIGLDLRLSVMPDGAMAIAAGDKPIMLAQSVAKAAEAAGSKPAIEATPPVEAAATTGLGQPDTPKGEASRRAAIKPIGDALRQLLNFATGEKSPLGALGQFAITDGKLVLDDQMLGSSKVFSGLQVQLDRSSGHAALLISAIGTSGRWRMTVAAADTKTDKSNEAQSLDVDLADISVDEISALLGLRELPFDLDSLLHFRFRIGAAADGQFRMARGHFGVGKGYFTVRDEDQEPFQIERVEGAFHWDDTRRVFVLEPTRLMGGGTRLVIAGDIDPPDSNEEPWSIKIASQGEGQLGSERGSEKPLPISRFELAALYSQQDKSFVLEKVAISGPQINARMNSTFTFAPEGRRLKMTAEASNMPVSAVMHMWPSAAGAKVRAWLLQNLKSGNLKRGKLQLDYGEEAFAALKERRALPDDAFKLEFELDNSTLTYLPGVPPAKGIAGRGLVTGKRSRFDFSQGYVEAHNGKLQVTGGQFAGVNNAPAPSDAAVRLNLAGQVEALAAVLMQPGMKQYAALSVDPSSMKGRIEGSVSVEFKISPFADSASTIVRATATATNVSIDKLVGKEKLEAAQLQLKIDGKDLKAQGTGKMFGSPATFSIDKTGKSEVKGNFSVTLDDNARQKMGWSTAGKLTGPVAMKFSGPLGKSEQMHGNIEFDLTKAAIAEVAPGIGKPAGRAAKAQFTLGQRGEATVLQGLSYQSGSTSLRGTIELDKKGGLVSAKLASLKLSPGDDLSGEISNSGDRLHVALRGGTIDLRPFIQAMTAPRSRKRADSSIDIDVKTKLATGYNRQALADFALTMSDQNGNISRFNLSGRAGRATVRGRLIPGSTRIEVATGDGGAVFAFLDLYKRMEGGVLNLTAQVTGGRIDGVLDVRNFVLKDEPALQRLVTEGVQKVTSDGKVTIDPSRVQFNRLHLQFSKNGGRILLHDAVINGPSVGTTLEGLVDFERDQVKMRGTFVPAYGLNNIFAKIPLFGPILGGGRNEGLLGVNYTVSGKASAPYLNMQPLSAIAPGFLRKIFGAVASGDPGQPPRPQMPLSLSPAQN